MLRFLVQCGARCYIAADVGDGHDQTPATAAHRLAPHRIVEITRIFAIDGDQRDLALPDLADAVASLRSTMGDEAFDAAWQSGWTMPIDRVMDQIAA